MAQAARVVFFVFAAWLIVGGIEGYVRAQSVISLVAGVTTGILALVAALMLPRNPTTALVLGIVTALLVGGSFVPRFLKAPALYPGGITVALSLVTLIVSIVALLGTRTPTGR